jgi:hypothetical protein
MQHRVAKLPLAWIWGVVLGEYQWVNMGVLGPAGWQGAAVRQFGFWGVYVE